MNFVAFLFAMAVLGFFALYLLLNNTTPAGQIARMLMLALCDRIRGKAAPVRRPAQAAEPPTARLAPVKAEPADPQTIHLVVTPPGGGEPVPVRLVVARPDKQPAAPRNRLAGPHREALPQADGDAVD